MNCPSCNSTDIQARGKRNALYPAGCLALISLPFAMLHQVASPHDYHCQGCGVDFARRTTVSKIARVVLLSLVLGLLLLFAFLAGRIITR